MQFPPENPCRSCAAEGENVVNDFTHSTIWMSGGNWKVEIGGKSLTGREPDSPSLRRLLPARRTASEQGNQARLSGTTRRRSRRRPRGRRPAPAAAQRGRRDGHGGGPLPPESRADP